MFDSWSNTTELINFELALFLSYQNQYKRGIFLFLEKQYHANDSLKWCHLPKQESKKKKKKKKKEYHTTEH